MQYDNIVFNTDVYCVRGSSGNFLGISTNAFLNAENTASYTSGGNGSITLQVCDAKAYMRYLGFKAILMTGLMRIDKEPGSSDGTLVQLTRNVLSDAVLRASPENRQKRWKNWCLMISEARLSASWIDA